MTSTRDLRDPQKLGEMMLKARESIPHAELSWVYDHGKFKAEVPNYPQDELLSTVTQREYLSELQEAAKEGDKYAAERLNELTVRLGS